MMFSEMNSIWNWNLIVRYSFIHPKGASFSLTEKNRFSFSLCNKPFWSKIASVIDENTIFMSSYNPFIALWTQSPPKLSANPHNVPECCLHVDHDLADRCE